MRVNALPVAAPKACKIDASLWATLVGLAPEPETA
jgi:hypothetical protein